MESKRDLSLHVGNKERMWLHSDKIRPRYRPETDLSLKSRARSRTRIVEPEWRGSSFSSSWDLGSSTEIEANDGLSRSPRAICLQTSCILVDDIAIRPFAVRRVKNCFRQSHVIPLKSLFVSPQVLSDSSNASLIFIICPMFPNWTLNMLNQAFMTLSLSWACEEILDPARCFYFLLILFNIFFVIVAIHNSPSDSIETSSLIFAATVIYHFGRAKCLV